MYPNPPQPERPPLLARINSPYWIAGIAAGVLGLCCIGGLATVAVSGDPQDATTEQAEHGADEVGL